MLCSLLFALMISVDWFNPVIVNISLIDQSSPSEASVKSCVRFGGSWSDAKSSCSIMGQFHSSVFSVLLLPVFGTSCGSAATNKGLPNGHTSPQKRPTPSRLLRLSVFGKWGLLFHKVWHCLLYHLILLNFLSVFVPLVQLKKTLYVMRGSSDRRQDETTVMSSCPIKSGFLLRWSIFNLLR